MKFVDQVQEALAAYRSNVAVVNANDHTVPAAIPTKTINTLPVDEQEASSKLEPSERINSVDSEEDVFRFCYHCGAEIVEETKSCPKCGKDL